jgi:chromosome segregation ATPase
MNTHTTLTQGGVEKAQNSIADMDAAMQGFERTTLVDLLSEQETLLGEANEVSKLDDAAERAARLEIINANMENLEAKIADYREDTAELIAGLEAQFEKLGIDLSALQKPTEEDLNMVAQAEAHLAKLSQDGPMRGAELLTAITDAESSFNPFGKTAKVEAAQKALSTFEVEHESSLAEAKRAIEEAKAEVERRKRKRIREAEFDSQFDRFIAMASQIQAKLLENVKKSEARIVETRKALDDALSQKETLASKIAGLSDEIVKAEDKVIALEGQVSSAVDQKSRATLEKKLGGAKQALTDLEGTKQEMQTAFNSFESAATKHDTMLQSINVQRDNQRSHARKLQIDSKARFIQAQNIVSIIQSTAQEDAASRLHGAGSTLDRTGLEIAARALIASERERINMLKGHERDMQRFADITGALAQGRAGISIEDAEIAARMQQNWGINPNESSWLQLAEKQMQTDSAQAA